MKNPIFHLILICVCLQSFAQEKLARSYTTKDGLASNTVYNVLVDKKGYLWFATDAGVSMFDGTTFTNFSAKDGLADNEVLSMFEDNDGRIWFVCFNKQPCFYYKGRFFNAGNFQELRKIKDYYWHTSLIKRHEVWFTGSASIYRFKDNQITEYPIPGNKEPSIAIDIRSVIYVLKDSVFYFLNEKTGKIELYPGLKIRSFAPVILGIGFGNFILIEHQDNRRTYLYKCIINPGQRTVEKKLICVYDKELTKSSIDRNNNILILTFKDNDVIEKDILSDSLNTIADNKFTSFVSDVEIDPQGNKWFTLLHNGVKMFPKTQSNVVSMPPEIKKTSTFFSIADMKGSIIAGNDDNTLFFIRNGSLLETQHENFNAENSRILDIKIDRHGKIWFGTDNGVFVYDPVQKRFYDKDVLSNIKDMKYDEVNDVMLVASSQGAFIISCKDMSRLSYINFNERTTSIAGNLYDTCWYETLNGLYIYHGGNSAPDTSLSPLFKSRVTSLETDKKRRLWVGTSSNGVFVVQYNKIIDHFTIDDGLTSNICKNIFIDENNEAWVSTNLGVSEIKIDQGPPVITKYNDKNCLADNDVNDVLVLNDTVYVVSSTGVVFFNKRNIINSYKFPVYISKVKIADSVIVAEDSFINLSSKENTLTISFSGLSYLSNGDIEYEYYIAELNNKPLFTKNNSVTYSSLSPGTYNFYVSATDVFGNHSIRPAHIKFTILPEWYQLMWLRWLAALAFVALSIFLTFKYSRQNEKRKLLKSELNETISRLELEAIHLQINPHFIFNCLNAIQNAIHKNNTESASYFINRFAKLMRKALMLSKESFITVDEEYSFINNYLELERLRHNNNFDYTIEIDDALNKNATFVPAFILQTFIENSINHGIKYLKEERGMISLRFIKNGKLEIRLDDNGIGITASKAINQNSLSQHSSKGLELMQARVDSLNKIYHRNIEVKIIDKAELNDNEHGTTVIISLDLL